MGGKLSARLLVTIAKKLVSKCLYSFTALADILVSISSQLLVINQLDCEY
jgi:hypothetical protein